MFRTHYVNYVLPYSIREPKKSQAKIGGGRRKSVVPRCKKQIYVVGGRDALQPLGPDCFARRLRSSGVPTRAQRSGSGGERSRSGGNEFLRSRRNEQSAACGDDVTPHLFATRGFPPSRAGLRGAPHPCTRPRSGPSALLTTARRFFQFSMPRETRYFLTISATLKVMASSNSRRSSPVSFLIFSRR